MAIHLGPHSMAAEAILSNVAADFRAEVDQEMTELIKKILKTAPFSAKMDLLGNSIVDGTTERWETYLRFASTLEQIEDERK